MSFRKKGYHLDEQQLRVLATANAALQALARARVSVVRASDFPGLASWGLGSYSQLNLYRTIALTAGMCGEWNAGRLINCVVLGRALIETVAAMWCVLDDIHHLLPAEDIRRIHARVMTAMFGVRNLKKGDKSFPPPVNVLTMMERLDKAYEGTRRTYEAVCEFVHPNLDAFSAFRGRVLTGAEIRLNDGFMRTDRFVINIAMYALAFLEIAEMCQKKYANLFKARVEELDRKFGRTIAHWPGDPAESWSPPQDDL